MVDELEPVVLGPELRQSVEIFRASSGDDVVAGDEATERVPFGGRLGVAVGRAGEHRAHGRPRMSQQEVPRAHGRVVEVR
jgi:hypothetical protein